MFQNSCSNRKSCGKSDYFDNCGIGNKGDHTSNVGPVECKCRCRQWRRTVKYTPHFFEKSFCTDGAADSGYDYGYDSDDYYDDGKSSCKCNQY